ncbi:MAG: phosphatase PAP2 family protein, partial [Nitrospirota bacterium]|nr:phosphatase PAP2 family protein [Nitrospirota bacterium]
AHGVAALATQLLKHTIGRPRPRVSHEGEFQFEPSLVSGFDSFPSGHASASFAVATVLTRHFPRFGWFSYLGAALIACSRVWRGSHFPTDVVAGAIVGVLSGAWLAYSYMDWRTLLSRALVRMTLVVMAAFTLLWTMVQASPDHQGAVVMTGIGIATMLAGVGLRWKRLWDGSPVKADAWTPPLLGTGLALSSGLWLASAGALIAGLAWIVNEVRNGDRSGEDGGSTQSSCSPWMEVALVTWFVLAFAVLQRAKGVLPIL